mgnify:CR=1 FL=1
MSIIEVIAYVIIPVVVFLLSVIVVPVVGWLIKKVIDYGENITKLNIHYEDSKETLVMVERDVKKILKLFDKNNSVLDIDETTVEKFN